VVPGRVAVPDEAVATPRYEQSGTRFPKQAVVLQQPVARDTAGEAGRVRAESASRTQRIPGRANRAPVLHAPGRSRTKSQPPANRTESRQIPRLENPGFDRIGEQNCGISSMGMPEIRASGLSARAFVFLWLRSPHFNDQIDPGRSNGVPHISSKQVESAQIFVPPLAEQRRIVAKVDELMAICDRLEAQLTTAEGESRRLLEAVLHEALASDGGAGSGAGYTAAEK
jgi:hypothetical protein